MLSRRLSRNPLTSWNDIKDTSNTIPATAVIPPIQRPTISVRRGRKTDVAGSGPGCSGLVPFSVCRVLQFLSYSRRRSGSLRGLVSDVQSFHHLSSVG